MTINKGHSVGIEHLFFDDTINLDELEQAILGSDYFDKDFYKTRFMADEDADDLAIVRHYLRYSFWDTRPPSEKFDAHHYFAVHADINSLGVSAFSHFTMFGDAERRHHSPLPGHVAKKRLFISELAPEGLTAEAEKLRVAICAHLFYPDYAALLLDRLADLPVGADIFISCTSQEAAEEIRAGLSEYKGGRVDIRTTPNRGRNFAPLIVEFGPDLLKYDVIGHIHSKKSLFTGAFQKGWAFHSIAGVLGTPDYNMAILNSFAKDDTLGLVSSEIYYDLPSWAYHELQNAGHLRQLESRLKLDRAWHFMDYPVGGMFWARKELLEPLINLDLSFDDFPEELGQTDGTLHHAIERILGLLVKQNDMRFLKYAPRHGFLFEDADIWKNAFRRHGRIEILDAIRHYDVVSFDFFDTMVMRDCADVEEAKLRVGRRHPSANYGSEGDYQSFRNAAELLARQNMNFEGDVGFRQIANAMVEIAGCDMSEATGLIAAETDEDLALLLPRQPVLDLYRLAKRMGKRVIITSDSYYPKSFIQTVLRKFDVPQPDAIYISSETQTRKDRGDMWPFLRGKEEGKIIHLGDNVMSDLQRAGDSGLATVFIPKAVDKLIALDVLTTEPCSDAWPLVRELVVGPLGSDPFLF